MNFLWYLAGIISGLILYHQLVPLMVRKMGKDKTALKQMVRNLNHDSFVNLRGAVEEESRRRDSKTC